MSARDKYSSNNLSTIVNTKMSQNVVQSTDIDFDGNSKCVREIYLNFIPLMAEQDRESSPPNIRINIDIPTIENAKKSKKRCSGPNIILSYNKKENLQITLSKKSKFQVKKIKQNKVAKLNRIVKFITFRKDHSLSSGHSRKEQYTKNCTIQLNLQRILDDNTLYSAQTQNCSIKHQYRRSKLYFNDYNLCSCSYESELDAYMRELKLRNELSSDP